MTGRPPKSMELHALEGTRSEVGTRKGGKRVAPRKTQRVTVGGRNIEALVPPLGLDDDCAVAWQELRGQCAAVLDQADAAMLEMAAVALGRFRQARASIAEHGSVIEVTRYRYGIEGTELQDNPAVKQEQTYAAMLHRACGELGVGPTSRARFASAGVEGMQASEAINGVGELVAIRGGRA